MDGAPLVRVETAINEAFGRAEKETQCTQS
jgi:hypothetical protein